MRIISGRFKGRQLAGFKAEHIRPTTDRVKESIFNKLMGLIGEARVLDLFSGTGNLAIEALSRGAAYVECVEHSRQSLRIIEKNLTTLNIKNEITVIPKDVLKYLKGFKAEPFDVIFVDPPFTEKIADPVMEELARSRVAQAGTRVVIESGGKEFIADEYAEFQLLDRKDFGDKRVSFFVKGEISR